MGERLLSYRGKDKDGEFLPKPSKAVMEANAKRWRDLHRLVERAWKAKQAAAPVELRKAA